MVHIWEVIQHEPLIGVLTAVLTVVFHEILGYLDEIIYHWIENL